MGGFFVLHIYQKKNNRSFFLLQKILVDLIAECSTANEFPSNFAISSITRDV